jgi:hypothetical protein
VVAKPKETLSEMNAREARYYAAREIYDNPASTQAERIEAYHEMWRTCNGPARGAETYLTGLKK